MTTFGYMRISTSESRQSFRSQRKALAEAGATRFYSDAISGTKPLADRPQLQSLLSEVTEGDVIVVYSLSRATRNLRDLLELASQLTNAGVGLRSVTEGKMDTTTPHGRFFMTLLGAMAEMEVEWTRERVRAGLAAARDRGRVGGRPPKLTLEQVELARRLRVEGRTIKAIGQILGVSRPTVYKALGSSSWAVPMETTIHSTASTVADASGQ